MDTKNVLSVAVATVLAQGVLNHAFDEQAPACLVTASTPPAQPCRDKEPVMDHHEEADVGNGPRDTNITPNTGSMGLVSARPQFFENPPPTFIKPQSGRLVTVLDQLAVAAMPCDAKPHVDDEGTPQTYRPTLGISVTPA
jgi:hypothetical protein